MKVKMQQMLSRKALMVAAFALLSAGTANAATSVIQVNDDVVRLGQIFHGIGGKSDIVIGSAPQPGGEIVLSARKLLQLAKANGVKWQPASGDDTVILRRASSGISVDAQTEALKTALQNKGVGDEMELVFTRPLTPLNVPAAQASALQVDGLSYDPANNSFTATLVAGSRRLPVNGSVNRLVSVPVLKSALQKGQMISASDLIYMTISASMLSKASITDADALIGKIADQTLEPNKPLRANDVEDQRLVMRGQDVDIIFANGPMQLRARGKALQNGTEDELVKVTNISSNKSLDARVTGDGEVTIY